MTKRQYWIMKYLDTQFLPGTLKAHLDEEGALVEIEDMTGERMCLTANCYGDIMDAETQKVIARSDMPHNRDMSYEKFSYEPSEWENMPGAFL